MIKLVTGITIAIWLGWTLADLLKSLYIKAKTKERNQKEDKKKKNKERKEENK